MNLLRGTLDLLVLEALAGDPRHGYQVARWVRGVTDGVIEIDDGALYTSLHRMESRGLIRAEWGVSDNNRRAKYYSLTAKGRVQLEESRGDWKRYADAVGKVLRAAEEA